MTLFPTDFTEDHITAEDTDATFTDMDSMVAEDMMDHAAEDADAAVEGDDKEVTEVEEEDDKGDHSEDAMDNAEEMAVNDEKEVEDEAEDADMSSGDAEDVPAADAASDEEADDDLFTAEDDTVVEATDSTDEASQMEEVIITSDNGSLGGDVTVAVSKSEGDGAVTKTFTTSVKSKLKGSGTNQVSSVSAFLEGTFDEKIIDLTSVKNEVDQTVEKRIVAL